MRIVVADDFEKLEARLGGTLKFMREIAKIAGRRGVANFAAARTLITGTLRSFPLAGDSA